MSFVKYAALAIATILTALYLSGYFFLYASKINPLQTTPITIIQYGAYYGNNPVIKRRIALSSLAGFGSIAAILAFIMTPRRPSLHGDARFATIQEIKGKGLLDGNGLLIGMLKGKYLALPGQQGLSLVSDPRSGKGVAVVIPNLFNFPDSAIVNDLKLENWTVTAGYRQKHGQKVYLFDPLSETGQTARWNPFHYVSQDPNRRINDVQRIAEMLYPIHSKEQKFWVEGARLYFLGISLYLFETPGSTLSIGEVMRQGMASGMTDEGFAKHWRRIISERKDSNRPLSTQCITAISDTIDLPPQTAGGIRKEFSSSLSLWLNPLLDAATAGNDFDFRELRSKRMTIYIGIRPDDIDRLKPVMNLFYQQVIGQNTRQLPEHNPALKYELLLVLDEFTAMGHIPILETASGFLPGYNIRLMLIYQSPSQLRSVYGHEGAETLLKTLGARLVFRPNDYKDAVDISNELGSVTVKVKSHSRPQFGGGFSSRNSSTISEQKRMLLLPDEVKNLSEKKQFIFPKYNKIRPFIADRINYLTDKNFKSRIMPPPVVKPIKPVEVTARHYEQTDDPTADLFDSDFELVDSGNIIEMDNYRPVTFADLENFDKYTLADFNIDYEKIIFPTDKPMSDDEIKAAAQRYLDNFIETEGGLT